MDFLQSSENFSVGRMSRQNGNFFVGTSSDAPISVGSFCAIARNVSLISANHDTNYPAVQGVFYKSFFNSLHPGEMEPYTRARSKGPIIIGNDVWIGHGAIILSGVTIGDGCCIGANSVVTQTLKPYNIAAGNPCRVIRARYSRDVVEFILKLQWWNWDDEKIRRNRAFFMTNLSHVPVEELCKLIID